MARPLKGLEPGRYEMYLEAVAEVERLNERIAELESGRVYIELQDRINELRATLELWLSEWDKGFNPGPAVLRAALNR
jgi:hypothetical protein